MIDVEPEVFCIGEPQINVPDMYTYLRRVGGQHWFDRVFGADAADFDTVPQAEGLIEFMGRLCYKSWEPGINKNVTKVREDRDDYLLNILRSAHGSVLTHAWFNFVIHNGSRVFTAEMNRHAVGTAISEQSLRYVRLDQDIPFRLPSNVLKAESCQMMKSAVEYLEDVIGNIYRLEGIGSEEEFFKKKTITSAVRRIAPLGIATEEGWSGNVRAIRHILEMRTNVHAEEEIRLVAHQIGEIMQNKCPLLFGDYDLMPTDSPDGVPEWNTEFRKV